jgi:hypothetical protein
MGLRFFRRLKLAPGLTLNLSRSGPSLSMGVRGAHVTVGKRGVTRTVGVPGTGLFYTSRRGSHTGAHSGRTFADAKQIDRRTRLRAELDELHRNGLLTDAEYDAKRRAIEPPQG